jgi:hypothetical protein
MISRLMNQTQTRSGHTPQEGKLVPAIPAEPPAEPSIPCDFALAVYGLAKRTKAVKILEISGV